MDTLHTVLRAIQPEKKSSPDHLTVFREFLAHLDRIQHKAPARLASAKPARGKPSRRKSSKRAK
nr:MAG TPA: hypothetical protein [Caudoviricetes sp.]